MDNDQKNGSKSANSSTNDEKRMPNDEKWVNGDDMKNLLRKLIRHQGLVQHHIEDFNRLASQLRTIATKQFYIEAVMENERKTTAEGAKISKIKMDVRFVDLELGSPMMPDISSTQMIPLLPIVCRSTMTNYVAPISISVVGTFEAYGHDGKLIKTVEQRVNNHPAGRLPIMVRSKECHTYSPAGPVPEELHTMLESPEDQGGYFIMKGHEIGIQNSENIKFNQPNIHRMMPPNKARVRLEMISKPGDAFENSFQVQIRVTRTNAIVIEPSYPNIKDSNNTNLPHPPPMPFYLMFRMLGMTNDRDIIDNIVFPSDNMDPVERQLRSILESAYQEVPPSELRSIQESYDQSDILLRFGEILYGLPPDGEHKTSDAAKNEVCSRMLSVWDRMLLPHIGEQPINRIAKARYLGYLIRNLLLVDIGILDPTDRDAYHNKRVHAAGVTLAKAFKTQFNLAVVQILKKELRNQFNRMDFSEVTLANGVNAIKFQNLEKGLGQLITSSSDKINMGSGMQVVNRVQAHAIERKNPLNVLTTGRNIESPELSAAATSRSEQMRLVKSSHVGYICPSSSKDTGRKVGLNKEMALLCTIAMIETGISSALVKRIRDDEDVIKLEDVTPREIAARRLGKVFVNGNWIGVVEKSHELVAKYRQMRRNQRAPYDQKIDRYTTIQWDQMTDEVRFLVDHGRLLRPLVIMDNNVMQVLAAEMAGKPAPAFWQRPRFTAEHAAALKRGDITVVDLIDDGVIEYIAPEEQLNCYIAYDIDYAMEHSANITKAFTHVDIPQAIYGLSAMVCPLANHNAPTRVTYETNQVKQTCGWYCLGWPWRYDKNMSLQLHCEHPLVRTLTNDLTLPIGSNAYIAYMCYDGDNQEDSVIMNKASTECGHWWVAYFRVIMTDLESGERVRIPSQANTMDIRSQASYAKLSETGIVAPGTKVDMGDVVIAKIAEVPPTGSAAQSNDANDFKYVDHSIVYNYNEPARVIAPTKTIPQTRSEGVQFAAVKTVSSRPVNVGSKFSFTSGCKFINANLLSSIDMPFCASGLPITCISNPHTVVSRMVVSQLIEGVLSKLCAQKCTFMDASAFTKIDMHAVRAELAKFGVQNVCLEQVYDGRTGTAIDALIVVCPTYIQRLQKFSVDEHYTVQYGPTDAITGQPTSGGRNTGGGLRVGEMEKDVLCAHGNAGAMREVLFNNSDGLDIYICRRCNNPAVVGLSAGIYRCKTCGPEADIIKVPSARSSRLFFHELNALGIGTQFITAPHTYSVPE